MASSSEENDLLEEDLDDSITLERIHALHHRVSNALLPLRKKRVAADKTFKEMYTELFFRIKDVDLRRKAHNYIIDDHSVKNNALQEINVVSDKVLSQWTSCDQLMQMEIDQTKSVTGDFSKLLLEMKKKTKALMIEKEKAMEKIEKLNSKCLKMENEIESSETCLEGIRAQIVASQENEGTLQVRLFCR